MTWSKEAGLNVLKSIVVDVGFETFSESRARLAADLAARFGASLSGFAAATIQPPMVTEGGAVVQLPLLNNTTEDIRAQLASHQRAFAAIAPEATWIGEVDEPTRALAIEAAGADLLVTSAEQGVGVYAGASSVDESELLLRAGRPVLVVPPGLARLAAERILVAWKDTREARRAVRDALPFLARAKEVKVVSVQERDFEDAEGSLDRVVRYLSAHGIRAEAELVRAGDRSSGARIVALARAAGSDMIVSGAYGHSRFREWVLGGVTRSLLEDRSLARLMSN